MRCMLGAERQPLNTGGRSCRLNGKRGALAMIDMKPVTLGFIGVGLFTRVRSTRLRYVSSRSPHFHKRVPPNRGMQRRCKGVIVQLLT